MTDESDRERLRRLRRETADTKDYPCGYAKPPAASRFSTTNQPRTVKRPSKSRDERIAEIADEVLIVKVNGVPRRMTRHEAFHRKIYNEALAGNMAAIRICVSNKLMPEPRPNNDEVDYGASVIRKIEEMAAARTRNEVAGKSDDGQDDELPGHRPKKD